MLPTKQVRTGLREADERPAVMEFKATARRIFFGCASIDVQERAVELLDIDAPILHHLEGMRVLHQSPRGFLRISKGAVGGELHCDMLFVRDLISQPKQ